MSKACFFLILCFLTVSMASGAMAETRVLTFDTNNWGTSSHGTWNTTKGFEGSGGNPGACVLFRGIGGVGGSFANNGFTGDFAAAGFRRISMDLKKKHWFLRPNNTLPKAYIFVRKQGCWWWSKQIQNFDPMASGYVTYSVEFDSGWTDAQAQANGWAITTGYGSANTATFSDTLRDVMETGFWIQDMAAGAECHVYVDNWTLSQAGLQLAPMRKPMKMQPAPGVRPATKQRYPIKKE
nr:hypothetical protein [uncultured Pseudodesulfovibrio sp.]